jgi:hypothetical protein
MPLRQVLQTTPRPMVEQGNPSHALQAQASTIGPSPQGFGAHSTSSAPPTRSTQISSAPQVWSRQR